MSKHDSPWRHRSPSAASRGLGLAPGLVPRLAPGGGGGGGGGGQERVPQSIATTIFE